MNAKICSSFFKSIKSVLVEDANISKEETIMNQGSLKLRNLPTILRSSNTKTSRNRKLDRNKIDTSAISNVEDGNTSLELNTSSSIDLDMEANDNKIASPRSHHQRKQVHTPLNTQYDISDYNNNQNKNILQKIDQLNVLHVSSSREKIAPTKKIKYDKQKKPSLDKKSKKTAARKDRTSRTRMSRKKPDILTLIPDINIKDTTVMQNSNNFLQNDIITQPICNPNFPNINVNDLYDIATKAVEPSNIFFRNNEVYNVEKKCDVNLNHVISCKPTEFNTMQCKPTQNDLTSYGFPIMENNLQQESMEREIGSNLLYEPKILCPCSCANCMSHDKDIIFYEDPVSTSTSNETEAEFFTCDLYTDIYDFFVNNYFHIFENNFMDFGETNLGCEEFGESNIKKENTCTGTKRTTEVIETTANMSIAQNQSQNLQPYHIDRIQNLVESYPTKFVTYPNGTVRMENARVFEDMDFSNYLNLENFSMKEGKIISQDEPLIQTTISTDISTPNSKCQTPENKKGK